jgi:hypothetical protein
MDYTIKKLESMVDFDLYPEGTENKVQVHVGIED